MLRRGALPGAVRRRVLEHDGDRADRHLPRPRHRHAEARRAGALPRRDRAWQRPDAVRAVHERARAVDARLRAVARPGVARGVPGTVGDGDLPVQVWDRGVCRPEEEVLHRREPGRPVARGGGPRVGADANDDRRPRDGRVAKRRARCRGARRAHFRWRALRRRQREAALPAGGDLAREHDRRTQRPRHLSRAREPDHRHQVTRRLRGARHGAARPRARVPLPGGPRQTGGGALRAPLLPRLEPDLRRPLVRPGDGRGPQGDRRAHQDREWRRQGWLLQGQHPLSLPLRRGRLALQ
mmetsp:Transcript_41756/g.134986  ORF Transcript_41756/g.134986 Transcript_41756/m.134986 type:complete len:296 (+) Transcript_41756:294-1181(+)